MITQMPNKIAPANRRSTPPAQGRWQFLAVYGELHAPSAVVAELCR